MIDAIFGFLAFLRSNFPFILSNLMLFALVAGLTGVAFSQGLRMAALALAGGAAGSVALAMLTPQISAANFWYPLVLIALGAISGPFINNIADRNTSTSQIWRKMRHDISNVLDDFRVKVITLAFAAAVMLTFPFGFLAFHQPQDSFWFGFYQAWTAGLVAFVLLGAGSTLVSLYRPERDHFRNRVRILFGTHDEDTINYLTESIQKLGYYSVSMERTYVLEKYNEAHKAYTVRVEHTTRSRNFLHDISVPDKASFIFRPDKFDPPIDVVGHLLTFNIADEPKVITPIPILSEEKRVEYDMHIPAGGEVSTYLVYKCLFKVGEPTVFRPARFARTVRARVCNQLESGQLVTISLSMPGRIGPIDIPYGEHEVLGPVHSQTPDSAALSFVLNPPA